MKTNNQALIKNVSRRNVLKGIVGTGGLVIAAQFVPSSLMAAEYATGAGGMPGGVVWDPHIFVSLGTDGTVTIVTHRSDLDQAPAAYDALTAAGGARPLGIVVRYPERQEAPRSARRATAPAVTGEIGVGFVGAGAFARDSLPSR
jgi:hypothetical protein